MKSRVLLSFFAVFAVSSSALARLNETPDRCALRYGKPIEEKRGAGWVLWTRVYERAPFKIAVTFYRKPYGSVKAGCIAYEKRDVIPGTESTRSVPMSEKETNALLGTVPGRWTSYESKSPLVAPNRMKGKRISDGNTIPKRLRDRAGTLIFDLGEKLVPFTGWNTKTEVSGVAHNGARAFAFRRYHTLFIISKEGIEALESWKKDKESRPPAEKKPALPDGF
ncbi:MAG: hypothetical protein HQ559_08245 [Lentisphaerae bacterium]|nr:hypothetical protein [Lentisphaerota bacterium]